MALIGTIRVRLQRNPQIRRRIRGEALWQNADNRYRRAVQLDGSSHDLRVAAEACLPSSVADDGQRWSIGHILGGGKHAAADRLYSENRKESAGNAERFD